MIHNNLFLSVTEKAWESASEEDEVEGEHVQPKQHPSAVSANVKNPSGKFDSSVLAGNAQLTANPTVGTVVSHLTHFG